MTRSDEPSPEMRDAWLGYVADVVPSGVWGAVPQAVWARAYERSTRLLVRLSAAERVCRAVEADQDPSAATEQWRSEVDRWPGYGERRDEA